MALARIFKSGNSQAVRLPKEFRLPDGEVEIFRRGDELVLKPVRSFGEELIEIISAMPDDMFDGIKDERPPEERDWD